MNKYVVILPNILWVQIYETGQHFCKSFRSLLFLANFISIPRIADNLILIESNNRKLLLRFRFKRVGNKLKQWYLLTFQSPSVSLTFRHDVFIHT